MVKSAFESLMIGLYLSVSSSVNPDPSKAYPTSKLVIPSFCLAEIVLFRIKRRTVLNSWSFRLNFLTGKAKAIEDKNTLFPQVWSFWSINKWTICYGDTRSFWSHSTGSFPYHRTHSFFFLGFTPVYPPQSKTNSDSLIDRPMKGIVLLMNSAFFSSSSTAAG